MVRFIIKLYFIPPTPYKKIYIPIWLDLLQLYLTSERLAIRYLHSNMVRFIIEININSFVYFLKFTFQYGQIYYASRIGRNGRRDKIYIPIWLDLLCPCRFHVEFQGFYLHSNMVRFIMERQAKIFKRYSEIYIPIWLDLLYRK